MIQLPNTSVGTLRKFMKEHKDIAFRYVVKEIERNVESDADKIKLFQLGDTHYVASIRRADYVTALQEALEFFMKLELFEDAENCKNIMKSIQSKEDRDIIEGFLQDL